MQNESKTILEETDECLSKGICSISPTMSAIQEIVLLYLKELSFYLLKLKELGITNGIIKETVIYALFNIVTNAEYNQDQFHALIAKLYDYIFQSRALYEKHCSENDIEIEVVKSYFKYSKTFDLTDAIRKGEKYYVKRVNTFTPRQKHLYDILFLLGKSLIVKIIELERLGKEAQHAYYAVLSILNAVKPSASFEEDVKKEIKKAINVYHIIVKNVFDTQTELYGGITQAEVSFSTIPGKAILVSGSDLKKLELVLKATENTDIKVYTHGIEMFMAHAFPKLRSHPNLKGHFGSGMESSILDFATFPGAILMTKGSLQRVEYLFRGRLFTLDPIPPIGVVKIENNNYEPLIKSTLEAKGFVNGHEKPSITVGYNEKEITKKVDYVLDKITKGDIKHLYIVGLLNFPNINKPYFQKFFELMPKNCYAISLCCPISRENVFHLDSFYDYSLFYKIISQINTRIPLNEIKMTTFLTKCDKHTIANLLYLNEVGIKNVYMCKCPPTLINPTLMETLYELFNTKEFFDPKKDIEDTLVK